MITTPEQARRLACVRSGDRVLCLGPRCMAWRWADSTAGVDFGFCGIASVPESYRQPDGSRPTALKPNPRETPLASPRPASDEVPGDF